MRALKLSLFSGLMLFSLTGLAGQWIPAANGFVPPKAFKAGHEPDGAPLYLCRAYYRGGLHPGKIRREFGGCNIPYDRQEITLRNYYVYINSGFYSSTNSTYFVPRHPRVVVDDNGDDNN